MNKRFYSVDEIESELLNRYPELQVCQPAIRSAFHLLITCYKNDGIVYIAGNGGSASDSEHIVGELMKSFMSRRDVNADLSQKLTTLYGAEGKKLAAELEGGLPAVSLPSLVSVSTAVINDSIPQNVYAQLIAALGHKNDIFWGISTSGNSENVVRAAIAGKAKDLTVISLCGQSPSRLDAYSDVVIHVPETETFKVQELHLPVYHALCAMCESYFFGGNQEG